MTGERSMPRLVTRATPDFRGITFEIRSREQALEAHTMAMYWARYSRWGNDLGRAAAWLTIAGELRCWAAGSLRRRQRHDQDPYPTAIETFPRIVPLWTDQA